MISTTQVLETAPFSAELRRVFEEYLVSQDNKRRVRPTNEKQTHIREYVAETQTAVTQEDRRLKFQAGKEYLLASGRLYTQAGLDSKGVKEQRFIPRDEDVSGNRRHLVASYCAFSDIVLFVPLDENYNLGYSLIRTMAVDVTAFAIGTVMVAIRYWSAFAIGAEHLQEWQAIHVTPRIRYHPGTPAVNTIGGLGRENKDRSDGSAGRDFTRSLYFWFKPASPPGFHLNLASLGPFRISLTWLYRKGLQHSAAMLVRNCIALDASPLINLPVNMLSGWMGR